jgi:hypothetical protein
MLDFIKNVIEPEAVLWGGDSIAHNTETLSKDDTLSSLKNVTKIVADGLNGIPVYPTIGNHDSYPPNTINVADDNKENPVFNSWSRLWLQFIPEAE